VTARRLPRWSELRSILQPKPIQFGAGRRLAKAYTVRDLREIALKRMPRAVFDYVEGGADEEISIQRSLAAFRRVEFHPAVLRDVSTVDTSTTILGRPAAFPLALAPTGFTRMMHHEGEPAVARAAARAGVPYALSTMGNTSIEDLALEAPDTVKWFQLYVWRDRAHSKDLMDRARSAGYDALVLTVDVPVPGARLRDARHGLTIPPALTLRTLLDGARHPAWWFNLLTTEPLQFASFGGGSPQRLAGLSRGMFDPAVTFDDIEWMRQSWSGALVVKGIQSVADARQVVDRGVDAVVVSNHGGRQLDRAPVPLELLPKVVDAIGDRAEVLLDTGVRSGADIVAAVALGARACLVGRAYLYGLMAAGQAGVERATDILGDEFTRTLQLLGVRRVADLDRSVVSLRPVGSDD
jgi:L-lactate dehydrogenase (cytochrome)